MPVQFPIQKTGSAAVFGAEAEVKNPEGTEKWKRKKKELMLLLNLAYPQSVRQPSTNQK
jgi:hypothetical protein